MKLRVFYTVYFSALAAECFANLTANLALQFVTKPSLMLILLVYFAVKSRNLIGLKFLTVGGLAFSWFGDIILLLDKIHKNLFIFGLLAFLIAHLFYIFYFLRIRKYNQNKNSLKPIAIIAVTAYLTVFYALLFPHLGNLKIPVFIYGAIISLMLLASFHAFDFAKQNFGATCVSGAVLFVASDSLLAINRFVAPFAFASVFIMLTYGIGQFLITEGSLRNLREIPKISNPKI
ncbi:MAG TPA: lysoplasmalogenase [Pyrinomonadaceae bacterium]|jgi:uncharacterized membrane protein YhhN